MASYDKLKRLLPNHLDQDEQIRCSVFGAYAAKLMGKDTVRNGILAATDRRLVFYAKKLTGHDMEVFPFENISSVEHGKNLMGNTLRIFTSGNKVEMKWIRQGEFDALLAFVQARIGKRAAPPVSAPAADPLSMLKQLGELRDAGVVSTEEFEAKKAEILSRL